jgi:hypothetical protein
MKKLVFSIIGLSFLGSIGIGAFLVFGGLENFNPATGTPVEFEEFFDEENDNEIEEIDVISEILDDILDEEDVDEGEELVTPTRRPVPGRTRAANLYENAFIRFSYPGFIEFRDETLNFLSVWNTNSEARQGTINIYNNVEELSLEEFVAARDNIVDYFAESASRGLSFEEFDIPTAIRAVKFSDYPEIETTDIYLVEFSGLVVLAKDFSEDKIVGEYLLRSMEKSR